LSNYLDACAAGQAQAFPKSLGKVVFFRTLDKAEWNNKFRLRDPSLPARGRSA
jgi:hypothetical protein